MRVASGRRAWYRPGRGHPGHRTPDPSSCCAGRRWRSGVTAEALMLTGGIQGRFVALVRVVHPRPPGPEEAIDNERLKRRAAFAEGVEYVARMSGAVQPVRWEDDGVTLVIPGDDADVLPLTAFRAAELIWQRARIDLNWPVRVAAHVARVRSLDDSDPDFMAEVARCCQAAAGPPGAVLAATEDLALALPDAQREGLVRLRGAAGEPVYMLGGVAPKGAEDPVGVLCDSLRKYVRGSDFARLRYVGFRLQRKEPPTLDVREVFIPQHVRLRRQPREERRGLEEMDVPGDPGLSAGDAAAQPLPLDAVIAWHESLVFLGDPGSGKTTLLRWLAVIAAGGRFSWAACFDRAERWIPVPLSVGRITELRRSFAPPHPSVVDVAARYFRERNICLDEPALRAALHEVLSGGQALVLFDGLDEVRSDERAAIRGWLESFAAQYPRCRFLATSREVGFSGFSVACSEEVRVEPFDAPQVESFVRAFVRGYRRMETGEDNVEASRKAAEDFLAALKRDPRLGALAKNPFLLSALALMHRSETRLPRHRVQAYELFARALCETWADARRLVVGEAGPPLISYEDEALPVLGHLALAMHEEHPDGAAPEEFVLDKLAEALAEEKGISKGEARKAAKAFLTRAGEEVQILLPRGPDQWGFLHLTFQEFFAAAGLHAQERFEEVLFEKLFDPHWLEVLRLGVGYLALVQKRPKKVNDLVLRVLACREPEPRAWLTEDLRKQVVRAAQLAAEAGDALRPEVQAKVVAAVAEWIAGAPNVPASQVVESLAGYDFAKPVANALLSVVIGGDKPRFGLMYRVRELDAEAVTEQALRAMRTGPVNELQWWLELLSEDDILQRLETIPERGRTVASTDLAQRRFRANIHSSTAWREAFRDPSLAHRDACALLLLRWWDSGPALDAEEGRSILVEMLADSSPLVRHAAIQALLRLPRWTPEIRAALAAAGPGSFGSNNLVWNTILAREAAPEAAIDPFVNVLLAQRLSSSGGLFVDARMLARALSSSEISDQVSERLVREVRGNADDGWRAAAVAALEHWGSGDAVTTAVDCLKWGSDRVRLSALWALERINAEETWSLWLDLIRSPDTELRTMALSCWQRWLPARRALLRDLLLDLAERDPDDGVRTVAIFGLVGLRSHEVVASLTKLAAAGLGIENVLFVLADWGIEDAAKFVGGLDLQAKQNILWILSEKLSSRPTPCTEPA